MAYITTDNNYITALCSKCNQEVKVDTTTVLSDGFTSWYLYQCHHCGHIGELEFKPEHRTYSLDEIVKMNKEETVLNRIADSLDEIKELLKERVNNE